MPDAALPPGDPENVTERAEAASPAAEITSTEMSSTAGDDSGLG